MSFRDRDDRNYDYDGYNWDDEEHKDVHFYRPDGDIEGKSIHWCETNGFYQLEEGTWSGDWYYEHFPDKIPGKEGRHKKFRDRRLKMKNIEREHRKFEECLDYEAMRAHTDPEFDWCKAIKLSQKLHKVEERKKELEYENNSDGEESQQEEFGIHALMDAMSPDDLERIYERLVLEELDEIEERNSETDSETEYKKFHDRRCKMSDIEREQREIEEYLNKEAMRAAHTDPEHSYDKAVSLTLRLFRLEVRKNFLECESNSDGEDERQEEDWIQAMNNLKKKMNLREILLEEIGKTNSEEELMTLWKGKAPYVLADHVEHEPLQTRITDFFTKTTLKPRSQPKPKPKPKPARSFLVPSQVVRKKK